MNRFLNTATKNLSYWLGIIGSLLWASPSLAQTLGCTDPLASNFNITALQNDGSCIYADATISPTNTFNLATPLAETSGLTAWNGKIWTHNDDTDHNIYALDSTNGNIGQTVTLRNTVNNDWEEISQDSLFLYIGDFGNNAKGNRTNLKILRIEKKSILSDTPRIDTIHFSYVDQTDFTPTKGNNTDFDCEAMIVSTDSIYLFTKQWISHKTSLYVLPKTPGSYIAQIRTTWDVQGLITGATYLPAHRLIALCGYSELLQPFLYLLYDFTKNDYFGGNKRKISIDLPFHQVEGIASTNGVQYYISNERFVKSPFINNPQQLHTIDLSMALASYVNGLVLTTSDLQIQDQVAVYPNPTTNFVHIKITSLPQNYLLTNLQGDTLFQGKLTQEYTSLGMSHLPAGQYKLTIGTDKVSSYTLIKK